MNNGLADFLAQLPTYELVGEEVKSVKSTIASAWMWPITTIITIACGLLIGKRDPLKL